jgi:hypothetical protein
MLVMTYALWKEVSNKKTHVRVCWHASRFAIHHPLAGHGSNNMLVTYLMEWRYPIEEREYQHYHPTPHMSTANPKANQTKLDNVTKVDQKVFLFLCFCLSLGYRNAAF